MAQYLHTERFTIQYSYFNFKERKKNNNFLNIISLSWDVHPKHNAHSNYDSH